MEDIKKVPLGFQEGFKKGKEQEHNRWVELGDRLISDSPSSAASSFWWRLKVAIAEENK